MNAGYVFIYCPGCLSVSLDTVLTPMKWPNACVSPSSHRNCSLPVVVTSGVPAEMLPGHRSLHFHVVLHPTFVNGASSNGPLWGAPFLSIRVPANTDPNVFLLPFSGVCGKDRLHSQGGRRIIPLEVRNRQE